jgi:hypothetical protein
MSKKFSILEIVFFAYVLHMLVEKNTKKIVVSIFWIMGSRGGGLKIGLLLFCALQIARRVPRYTN